jgi:hypothetical protein
MQKAKRIRSPGLVFGLTVGMIALSGCTAASTVAAPSYTGASAPSGSWGGAGPPPGRTASERAARKEYYRGPRADEF